MHPEQLRAAYDAEIRARFLDHLPAGWEAEVEGPLVRCRAPEFGFAMLTGPSHELGSDAVTRLVERTAERLADLEWEFKTWDHDHPALRGVLERAGAHPEEHEALVIGEAAPLADEVALPPGLTVRETRERADLERIAELGRLVWGHHQGPGQVEDLMAQLEAGAPVRVFLVEDGDLLVSAARIELVPGTGFAGLWGGNTHPDYRGRGVYRALVAIRARVAVEAGYRYLQVDASDDSRPILERLGLQVVGGTQPWVFQPAR